MMHRLAFAAALSVTLLAPAARADDDAPSTPSARSPEYTAPLYQTTQPSYVPQSVALSGPTELKKWSDGDPIPPGYHKVERMRRGLVIGGAITFGTVYFFNALAAAAGQDSSRAGGSNELAPLWVPGVGPFIMMGQTHSATANVFLAGDGIAQCAGLAMLIYGLTSPKSVLVRNDLAKGVTIHAAPVVARGTTGMGVVGTF